MIFSTQRSNSVIRSRTSRQSEDPSMSYKATIRGMSCVEGGDETTVPNGRRAIDARPEVRVSTPFGIDICSGVLRNFTVFLFLNKLGTKALVETIERPKKHHDVPSGEMRICDSL